MSDIENDCNCISPAHSLTPDLEFDYSGSNEFVNVAKRKRDSQSSSSENIPKKSIDDSFGTLICL